MDLCMDPIKISRSIMKKSVLRREYGSGFQKLKHHFQKLKHLGRPITKKQRNKECSTAYFPNKRTSSPINSSYLDPEAETISN